MPTVELYTQPYATQPSRTQFELFLTDFPPDHVERNGIKSIRPYGAQKVHLKLKVHRLHVQRRWTPSLKGPDQDLCKSSSDIWGKNCKDLHSFVISIRSIISVILTHHFVRVYMTRLSPWLWLNSCTLYHHYLPFKSSGGGLPAPFRFRCFDGT